MALKMFGPKSPAARIGCAAAAVAALTACTVPPPTQPVPTITFDLTPRSDRLHDTALQLARAATADMSIHSADWQTDTLPGLAVGFDRLIKNKNGITTDIGLIVGSDSTSARQSLRIPLAEDVSSIIVEAMPTNEYAPIFHTNIRLNNEGDSWTGYAICGNSHKGGGVDFDDSDVDLNMFDAALLQLADTQSAILSKNLQTVSPSVVC